MLLKRLFLIILTVLVSNLFFANSILAQTTSSPYGGSPAQIPGKIEAEEYDLGGPGVAYFDTTTTNQGGNFRSDQVDIKANTYDQGFSLGWMATGEWLKYTISVQQAGKYRISAMAGNGETDNSSLELQVNNQPLTSFIAPKTGNWDQRQLVYLGTFDLQSGVQELKVLVKQQWVDLDYLLIELADNQTTCHDADIDKNGVVDIADYSILVANFFVQPIQDIRADVNKDGVIDLSDYSLLVGSFFEECSLTASPSIAPTATNTSTPFPTSTSTPTPTIVSVTTNPTFTPTSTLTPTKSPTPTQTSGSPGQPASTLKAAGSKHGIKMGAAIKWTAVTAGEQAYLNTLTREYNYVVAENEFKQKSISINSGSLKFSTTDAFMAWAESNNFTVGAHTLVWHQNVPSWLESSGMSNSQVEAWLENYIKTIVGRYRGRIDRWDVVNEPIKFSSPFTSAGLRTDSFWHQKVGADYMEKAFRWAHQADPNAKLFINEYSTEWNNAKTDKLYEVVVDLLNKGVPIHGVGFQVHPNTSALPTYDQVYASMKRFNDLGLELAITEMDIAIPLPVNNTLLQRQASTYGDVARACRQLSRCHELTTWGFTDKYSWVNSFSGGGVYGGALPFDSNYNKKPAYNAILDELNK